MVDAAILEKEALQLPEAQRALLADRLLQSLSPIPPDLRQTWIREADDRMKAFREGTISAIDGPQVMADLRSQFAK